METVKPALKPIMARHFKELMSDAEVYGWAPVWVYLAVWLLQIENHRAQWMGARCRCQADIQECAGMALSPSGRLSQASHLGGRRQKRTPCDRLPTTTIPKSGTKIWSAFSRTGYTRKEEHPAVIHPHLFFLPLNNQSTMCPSRAFL